MNNDITVINNTFHEGNNTNCFNYFQANFKNNTVTVKIIPHLPTRNIISFIKNNQKLLSFIKLKDDKDQYIQRKRGLYQFEQGSIFQEYQTNPNNRNLEKEIKENVKKYINTIYIPPSKKTSFQNYLDKLPPHNLEKFDFDNLLKNDYVYYYILTCYIIENKKNNIEIFNNESFFSFRDKFENLRIETIEEYQEKINSLKQDNPNIDKINFIINTENFIIIPDYDYLITPQDLNLIFFSDSLSIDFINIKLKVIYKCKYNISSIIDAGILLDNNEITLDEWKSLLKEVETNVHLYYKNIFNLEQHLKPIEEIPGINIKKDNIIIWTNLHPTVTFFYFTCEFVNDNVSQSVLKWDYYSRINLEDVIQYSKMNILSNFIFNFVSKKRDVEFFNCFDSCQEWIYNSEETPDITREMYENYIHNKHSSQELLGGNNNISDKINLHSSSLQDITREEILQIIENISWHGSITLSDCNIKIYGSKIIKDKEKEEYVLYIIPHLITNDEIENYLQNSVELFEYFYLSQLDYVLYLHKINNKINSEINIEISDNIDKSVVTINTNIKNETKLIQKKDNYDNYYVKIKSNKCFRELMNDTTTEKFKQKMFQETGEIYISHMIFEEKVNSAYSSVHSQHYPIEINPNIFKYIRFLLIKDRESNFYLKNSLEFSKIKNNVSKSPYFIDDKLYSCLITFFIGHDNKIKLDRSIDINSLTDEIKFKLFIKNYFENIYNNYNYVVLVGYLMPWRKDNSRVINIFSLLDSDYDYLKNLVSNAKKSIINFINNLEINISDSKSNFLVINKNHIEIYAHYPNDNGDIHLQFYIHKKPYSAYSNRKISYDFSRSWDINQILNFMSLKVEFFKNICFTSIFNYKKYYIPLLNMYKHNKYKYIQCNDDIQTQLEGGGNSNEKFIKWIDKYLNEEQIFEMCSIPVIWIEFDIQESKKEIHDKQLLEKYYNCFDINKYNTVENTFYKKLYYIYNNINKHTYRIEFIEKLLFRKFKNIMIITKHHSEYDNFYFSDNLQLQNYNKEYDSKKYDLIQISHNFDSFKLDTVCKTYLHFKKFSPSLLWSIDHLNENGVICLLIREGLIPQIYDLILLLQQYSSTHVFYDYYINDGTTTPIYLLCEDFRDTDKLKEHLKKLLKFEPKKDTGFLKVKKVIRGNLQEFHKPIKNMSSFVLNRISDYINCFKNSKGEYEVMPEDVSKLIETNAIILMSKIFTPKPENMPYISSLLHLKKMKVGNNYVKVHSNIKNDEGKLLYNLIRKTDARNVLEIGMAYGLSSLFILQSLKYFTLKHKIKEQYNLTSIDPFQTTQWDNLGVQNLINAHLDNNHTLIEQKSYISMPILLNDKKIYDIIFIDGWHTFDYTLLDLFYAYLLVKKNGFIVIDDALHPGVNKVTKYIETNYSFLKKVFTEVKTVAVYQKIGDDNREWNFHKDF